MSTVASEVTRRLRQETTEMCLIEECEGGAECACFCDSPGYHIEVSIGGFFSPNQGFHGVDEDEQHQASLTITSTPEGIIKAAQALDRDNDLPHNFFLDLLKSSRTVDPPTRDLIYQIINACRHKNLVAKATASVA